MNKLLINLIPFKKIRRQLRNKYYPKIRDFTMDEVERCLMVAPHPDDETLAAGGLMLKYPNKFDCICMASAGVKTPTISAEDRADLRIKEFSQVMDAIGIKNRWIYKTFGVPPMNDQIEKYFTDYCTVLDTKQYDCFFLPHPKDNHPEHQYITNNLFKRILKRNGYKTTAKVVFYEVWTPLSEPNYFEDISRVATKKTDAIKLYYSQNGWIKYPERIEGLNKYRGMLANNVPYAEAFRIIPIVKYLKGK